MIDEDFFCLLDFYIRSAYQRGGWGFFLFSSSLSLENRLAKDIAYDKPSFRLYPFLEKYYGLVEFVEQPNRYVIFEDHF